MVLYRLYRLNKRNFLDLLLLLRWLLRLRLRLRGLLKLERKAAAAARGRRRDALRLRLHVGDASADAVVLRGARASLALLWFVGCASWGLGGGHWRGARASAHPVSKTAAFPFFFWQSSPAPLSSSAQTAPPAAHASCGSAIARCC